MVRYTYAMVRYMCAIGMLFPWISMDAHGFHGYPWIPMDIHGFHGYPWIPWISMDSSENTRSLIRCFLMKCNHYKEEWKSRFDRKIEIWLKNIKSNPVFHRKPNIILWSLRSFWVERFAPNQCSKFGFVDEYLSYVNARNRPKVDFFPNRSWLKWPIANWSHMPPDTSCMPHFIYFAIFMENPVNSEFH